MRSLQEERRPVGFVFFVLLFPSSRYDTLGAGRSLTFFNRLRSRRRVFCWYAG